MKRRPNRPDDAEPLHDGATLPLPIGGGGAWLELLTDRVPDAPSLFDAVPELFLPLERLRQCLRPIAWTGRPLRSTPHS